MIFPVRAAEPADAAAMAELVRQAFEEHRGRLDPPSGAHAETEATLCAKLAQGGGAVAVDGGTLVGCVLWAERDDHAYLHRLGVLPSHRRRGLAKALIAHVEGQAREKGMASMRLGVRRTLEAERACYERLGYAFHSHGYHEGHAEPTFAFLEKAL